MVGYDRVYNARIVERDQVEVVQHIDGDPTNNALSNLKVRKL